MTAKKKINLTSGSIPKSLLLFTLPLFVAQFFQQFYSLIDSIIVSNFDSEESLGAIVSTGSLNFLFFGLISGIFLGAGVLISRYYGAKNIEGVRKSAHTSIAFAIVTGLILAVVGVIFTRPILELMNSDPALFDASARYIQVIFAGSIITALFNCASGIFQATGDSKSPLKFLLVAAVVNIVLDLLFVAVFKWSVTGAALATLISQLTSAVLSFRKLMSKNSVVKINIKEIRFHRGYVKDILIYGIPSGISNSVMSLANVFVQANVNTFGETVITGNGSYIRLEQFAFIPITSFSMGLTSFVSQNIGALQHKRAKKGAVFGVLTTVLLAQTIGIILYFGSSLFLRMFTTDPDIIYYGTLRAKIQCLFYFAIATTHATAAVLRGAGRALTPMIAFLLYWCLFRIIYINVALNYINKIETIYWAYPISWSLSAITLTVLLFVRKWNKTEKLAIV